MPPPKKIQTSTATGQENFIALRFRYCDRQRRVVDVCGEALLTSYGLRSLAPEEPEYKGIYGGDRLSRDGSDRQGTVWGWLIGPFALAHLRVYGDRTAARELLAPMAHNLLAHGVGSPIEIFDADAPMHPERLYRWGVDCG